VLAHQVPIARLQSTPTIGGALTKHAYHRGSAYKARLPSGARLQSTPTIGGALTKHQINGMNHGACHTRMLL